jgi:hypothetical protein
MVVAPPSILAPLIAAAFVQRFVAIYGGDSD